MCESENVDSSKELHKLLERIESCLKCYKKFAGKKKQWAEKDRIRFRNWHLESPWLFPPDESGVEGFFGTGKVIFVCHRPSTGRFGDKASLEFYKKIRNHGFSDAHITDMVKCRKKAKDKTSEEEMENCLTFLKEEIEILPDARIVAVGTVVRNELRHRLEHGDIEHIRHYSSPQQRKGNWKDLEHDLKELAEKIAKEPQKT